MPGIDNELHWVLSVFLENLKSRQISPEVTHDIHFPAHKRPTMNLTFPAHLTPPPLYLTTRAGADPGFVGPEAHKILGTLWKKKNRKLQIQKLISNVNIYL